MENDIDKIISEEDDGRVYEYTGKVSVLRGEIIIPHIEDAPGAGPYMAKIVLWPINKQV